MVHKVLPILVTAVITATVFAAGPTVAQAAYDAMNADKVDGKHAVGAGASPAQRAGKLVATDARGMLPGNIVPRQTRSFHVTAGDGESRTLLRIDGLTVKMRCEAMGDGDPATTEVQSQLVFSGAAARMDGLNVHGPFNSDFHTSPVDRVIPATGDGYPGSSTNAGKRYSKMEVFLKTANSVTPLDMLFVADADAYVAGADPCLAWVVIG